MKKKTSARTSRTDWDRLRKMDEKDIDTDDMPELDAAFFRKATVRMPAPKKAVSIRLDGDVLDWFKEQGKPYQSRINAVLRAYVEAHRKASHS